MNRMHPNANSSLASTQDRKYKILPQTADRHRGKPRNPAQEQILLNFIKKHPGLLQNPSWDNRNAFESLWEQLTAELNGHGPPQKDVATWKKVVCSIYVFYAILTIYCQAGLERLEKVYNQESGKERNAQYYPSNRAQLGGGDDC